MGWQNDTFDFWNTNKTKNQILDEILHFIKINKNVTVDDIRKYIIEKKKER